MRELEFYMANGGKYPFAPRRDQLGKTRFITTPTTYYDDLRGQRLLEDYVSNTVFAEELGFDGCVILEQHGGPNALVGQSIVMAAAIIAKTHHMRVGTVGAIMNSYFSPQRYAEEIATLDILSRGRYFFGLPMGIGPNYHTLGMNPTYARERFREAHEFLVQLFGSEEPFRFDGKFFQTEYANLWPKPLQRPAPECWIPAAGSKESLAFAAAAGYTYLAVLVPRPILLQNCKTFRDAVEASGQVYDPRRIVASSHVYVAETDKQARLEAEAHLMSLIQNNLGSPFHDSFPPGHVTPQSLRGMAAGAGYRSKDVGQTSFEEAQASGQIIVGSPETVAERIEEMTGAMGAGRMLVTGDCWTMPPWMARKSMTMFAEEVMPRFRSRSGKPAWDRRESIAASSHSEYGARVSAPAAVPSAYLNGVGNVDIRTAHVPELRKSID